MSLKKTQTHLNQLPVKKSINSLQYFLGGIQNVWLKKTLYCKEDKDCNKTI